MLKIDYKIKELYEQNYDIINNEFKKIEKIEEFNSNKILNAFINNNVSEVHFNMTTGYGYNDIGRDTIEKIYAEIFGAEDALVRGQFISGTHALTVCFQALLRKFFSNTGTNSSASPSY